MLLKWTPDIPKFSTDIELPIWQGHSVTNVALQIAYYMGFKTVYIVGMDHNIVYNKSKKVGGKYINTGEDPNHFDPNYFVNVKYNHQSLKTVEKGYKLAYKAFIKDGRDII